MFTEKELKNERWKDIFGYDGMYQVSDLGRVRSRYSGEWKVLRPGKTGSGYLCVILCKHGKQNKFLVHRLVASYFVENDNIFNTEINHINEIKTDNRASNLEWCDRRYNMNYNGLYWRRKGSVRRKIEKQYDNELSIKQNLEIFREKGIECSYYTVVNLRKDLGISKLRKKTN